MELVFGHLEVLHFKFHDPTISNLGDQSGQTDIQTDKQTNRQCNIYSRYSKAHQPYEIGIYGI